MKEKEALNDLKNKQSFAIKLYNKGRGICIMNTRDYITKIHTPSRSQYIEIPNPQPNKRNSLWCSHSPTLYALPTHNRQRQWNFYCLAEIPEHLFSKDYQKYTNQTAFCILSFLSVMIQLKILSSYIIYFIQHLTNSFSLPIKDKKDFLQLIEKLPPSHPIQRPWRQTFYMMMT